MGPIILLFTLQMGKSRLGVEGLGFRAQGFELSLRGHSLLDLV